jgi:HPt (histidine-containing phosphotransfer) domain-containing protein
MTSQQTETVDSQVPPAVDMALINMLREWRAAGAPDPLIDLTAAFVEDGSDRLLKLRFALAAGDQAAARRAAHSLKGMSGSIGANYLCELVCDLETATPGTVDGARVELIEREFERVAAALQAAAN